MASGFSRTGNIRALSQVFFGRLFENDVFSSSVAASSSVVWLLALVATPGVMVSGMQIFSYAHLHTMPQDVQDRAFLLNRAFHIDFVMAIAGVVTMLVWSSLTPDRRDAQVLGPLPVRVHEQAFGRLLALLKFFGLFAVAVSVPAAFAYTFVSTGADDLFSVPQRVAGHITAAVCAGGFVFFMLVNTQLILAALFGPRAIRFVTLPLQLASLAGIIAAVGFSEVLSRTILDQGVHAGPGVTWNPAAWFLGIYLWLSGDPLPIYGLLAIRGVYAAVAVAALAIILYPAAYGRCLRLVIDSEGRRTGRLSRAWAGLLAQVLRPLLRTPLQRGLAAYMIATLGRSHTHRFVLGSYAGLAFLLSLPLGPRLLHLPTTGEYRYAWFAIPLGLVFWMVCGMRVAILIPIEPSANWIFKLTEPVDKRRLLSAVVTVMASLTCVPIAAMFAGAAWALGETRLAVTVFLIVMLAGLCLIEGVTLTLKVVPFTCTYLPGQLRMRVYWAPYFFLWLQFVFTLSNWCLWAFQGTRETLQLAAFLAAVWVALRLWRMARARRITTFVYDEQPPSLMTTMDIQGA